MSIASIEYDHEFFDAVDASSHRSANVLVPIVLDLISAKSVVDVGCGRGAWLAEFQQHGVPRIKGYDSKWVQPEKLWIDSSAFEIIDLSKPFSIDKGFDLAVCLEVGEHLPAKMAQSLVECLTMAAPTVLFSAALPGQGGTHHINEQWHGYWHRLFSQRGFDCFDVLRPRLCSNRDVAWWFRQNIFMYAARESGYALDLANAIDPLDGPLIPIASHVLLPYTSFSGLVKALPSAGWRAIRNRVVSFIAK